MGSKTKIKFVSSKKIKPIPWPKRKPIPLIIGADYYIAFGPKNIYKGKLISVFKPDNRDELWVRLETEDNVYTVYADEIGRSIEESLQHEVTF